MTFNLKEGEVLQRTSPFYELFESFKALPSKENPAFKKLLSIDKL